MVIYKKKHFRLNLKKFANAYSFPQTVRWLIFCFRFLLGLPEPELRLSFLVGRVLGLSVVVFDVLGLSVVVFGFFALGLIGVFAWRSRSRSSARACWRFLA